MACPISDAEINKLKTFITICKATPTILNMPQLDFFKTFIEHFGGKVPAGEFNFPKPT